MSVALHEYSFKTSDIWFCAGIISAVLRKQFAACDKHRIARPKVIITEWGWTHERVPGSIDVAMKHIDEVAAYYAQFPEILGAAIWYLGPGFAGIANRAQKLIKPVTDYSLSTTFEIPDPVDTPDPVTPPMTLPVEGCGQTAVSCAMSQFPTIPS
ncbi:MAG: hypothetical protein M5U34_41155 [Chloroflexi bacterium]|nr:hypothetical protein [Chloroflexota bacterium]